MRFWLCCQMGGMLLLLAQPACADDLKLATWSLGWLTDRPAGDPSLPASVRPKRDEDIARMAAYANILAADVVAFQEADGAAIAARIFPPDRYALHLNADSVTQRVGFAVRRGIAFQPNPDVTGLDVYPHARFRLRSGADITLAMPGGALRLLAVHLKAGCRADRANRPAPDVAACATLSQQFAVLDQWAAARRAEGAAFAILGNFNRQMDGADAMFDGLAQVAAPLLRATAGRSSPCWGGSSFVDHIIVGGAAAGWLRPATLRVLVYRETGPPWPELLSDHCAVSVRLALPDGTP